MKIRAIVNYPLSNYYKEKLSALYGDIDFLSLKELRAKRPFETIKYLFSLTPDKLLLPYEDESASSVLPILFLLAFFTRSRVFEIISPRCEIKKISRILIFCTFFGLAFASLICLYSAISRYFLITYLLKKTDSAATKQDIGDKKNILYINANMWFGIKAGGSVGHIAGVVNAFVKRNFGITYASLSSNTLVSEKVKHLPISLPSFWGIPTEFNLYRNCRRAVSLIIKKLRKEKFDFIYQRLSMGNITGVIFSKIFKIPLVTEYNGSEVWISKNWGNSLKWYNLAAKAEQLCLKHSRLIVTVSEPLKEELIRHGIGKEKITMYPNCVDPDKFAPERFSAQDILDLRNRYNLRKDSVVITFLGTFGVWHGVDILARAIKILIDKDKEWLSDQKVHFMLIGDGVKMGEVLEIFENGKYVKEFVTFTGLVEQKLAPLYLASSDILVSPHVKNSDGSKFFGSPTKLFEYMAAEKAIYASDLDQIGEVLSNSINVGNKESMVRGDELAVLGEPGSVEDLVEGLKFLVKNKNIRTMLGKNAAKEVLKKYTWDIHVSKILEKLECI